MAIVLHARNGTPFADKAYEESSELKMAMILSVVDVLAGESAEFDIYGTAGQAVRGGNSKGVRSLHRQNHLGGGDYSSRIVSNFVCNSNPICSGLLI